MRYLHFTIGPVQGFVAQARRTRDLWAGSFLLSYLSGWAIKEVVRLTGQPPSGCLEKPDLEGDKLWEALNASGREAVSVGSIPNQFVAKVPEGFDATGVVQAVQSRWKHIADKVWERFVAGVAGKGRNTQDIWESQVNNFWEMAWVLSEDAQTPALAMRKNWRTHAPPPQPGDKCTLMSDWQEISGYSRNSNRKEQDEFWSALRAQPGVGAFDFEEGERLCAIALIKRLYPKIDREVIGWELGQRNWPSSSYMAAVPWLRVCLEKGGEEATTYLTALQEVAGDLKEGIKGEYRTQIKSLVELRTSAESSTQAADLTRYDGRCFFASSLEQLPWKENLEPVDLQARVKMLRKCLEALEKKLGGPPSPYYAVLLMDGDNAGRLISQMKAQGRSMADFSRGLTTFANQVQQTIYDYDGRAVYAGGDDVLALLPIDRALQAAEKLRKLYAQSFGQGISASTSAAVVFAHHSLAMRGVLAHARYLLDEVAKEANGRASIAAAALNSSGPLWEWVSTWVDSAGSSVVDKVIALVEGQLAASSDGSFSSRFFYKIRERYEGLTDHTHQLVLSVEGDNPLRSLLVAEYLKTREGLPSDPSQARARAQEAVDRLLEICRKRTGLADREEAREARTLLADGAIMVRFLASKGVAS